MTTEPDQLAVSPWERASQRLQSFADAGNVPRMYRAIYDQCRIALLAHQRYTAGTDAGFNAAINALFTVEEWAELNVMKAQLQNLVNDWDTNHGDAVGKPKVTILPSDTEQVQP